jgi:hypothetical protein
VAHPKLFISYSWSNPDHEKMVLELAVNLTESGVEVILDKWDLKAGHDAYVFMEQMVNDPDIHKVACIMDKAYAEKADGRAGGVGTESQIISKELYSKTDQSKFVAVVTEKDEQGQPYLPAFFRARIYIDLSSPDHYSENYEQLLRWIYDQPMHVKPEIGSKPAFLDTDQSVQIGTSTLYRHAIEAIRLNKAHSLGALNEYLKAFADNLERFRIPKSEDEYDELLLQNIDQFLPARNEFIQLLLTVCAYPAAAYGEALHQFFENLIHYLTVPISRDGVYREGSIDNFRFIIHELFLYAIAVLLKQNCFDIVYNLVAQDYYKTGTEYDQQEMLPYTVLRAPVRSLKYRNERLQLRRISLHADMLEKRASSSGIAFKYLMQADFVLFMRDQVTGERKIWWPETLVYLGYNPRPFEIFVRAESRTYFDKFKHLLGINELKDLDELFTGYQTRKYSLPRWDFTEVDPQFLMAYDRLAKKE